jgi:hypothetical protein
MSYCRSDLFGPFITTQLVCAAFNVMGLNPSRTPPERTFFRAARANPRQSMPWCL